MFYRSLVFAVLAGFAIAEVAHAEETTGTTTRPGSEASSTVTTAATPGDERIIGGVELRPSWTSAVGEVHSENWVQLGYQFTRATQVFYRQEFNTNVYNPGASAQGLGLFATEGSVRLKVKDFYKPSAAAGLSYELRTYLPTLSTKRDAGMITSVRNQLKATQNLGSAFSVSLEEIPILHVYDRPGIVGKKGAEANPVFENRVYLTAEVKPMTNLKLAVPLILNNVRYRAFQEGAKNNNGWGHKLWVYPELTYTVTPNTMLGLGYYSDNLVLADFGGTNIGTGLEKGITQLILNASL